MREVLGQGGGGRVPVGIADAQARRRRLPGQRGQLPQQGGVVIQRGPAVAGEGDGDLGPVAARPSRPHVPGVAQLVQAGDQAAGRQAGHVLQSPGGDRVAVRQCRQGRYDAQPRRVVDQRVEYAGGHDPAGPANAPAMPKPPPWPAVMSGATFMMSPRIYSMS